MEILDIGGGFAANSINDSFSTVL